MSSRECFVDSVCWIALLNFDDELHEVADSEYKQMLDNGYRLVTSSAVLNEVANSLCKLEYRRSVVDLNNRLQKSRSVEIVFVTEDWWRAAWKLFEEREDKEWSLTDCISITIMKKRDLADVLTNDKHFVQAGFNAVFRISQTKQ